MGKTSIWAGRILSGLAAAFFLLDGTMKLVPAQIVIETMKELGWPGDIETARLLGFLTLGSAVLYIMPRTAVLGAILASGYLGGAVATHVRIGSPLFSHVLFGVYLGAMIWGGLWLRDPRVRALIPLTRPQFTEI